MEPLVEFWPVLVGFLALILTSDDYTLDAAWPQIHAGVVDLVAKY